jgi:hypothetical protein
MLSEIEKKARHKEAGRKNRLKTKQKAEADQRKAEAQLRKLERGRIAGQKFRDKKKAAMMEDEPTPVSTPNARIKAVSAPQTAPQTFTDVLERSLQRQNTASQQRV